MAFDGITIANLVKELKDNLLDGRINKIAQPESDELLLTIKTPNGQKRLYMSSSASIFSEQLNESPDSGNRLGCWRNDIISGAVVDHFLIEKISRIGINNIIKLKRIMIDMPVIVIDNCFNSGRIQFANYLCNPHQSVSFGIFFFCTPRFIGFLC